MQTKMFVFIGLTNSKLNTTTDELHKKLQEEFSKTDINLLFTKKEKMVTARHNNVSYYISILDSNSELEEWLHMAKNF